MKLTVTHKVTESGGSVIVRCYIGKCYSGGSVIVQNTKYKTEKNGKDRKRCKNKTEQNNRNKSTF